MQAEDPPSRSLLTRLLSRQLDARLHRVFFRDSASVQVRNKRDLRKICIPNTSYYHSDSLTGTYQAAFFIGSMALDQWHASEGRGNHPRDPSFVRRGRDYTAP